MKSLSESCKVRGSIFDATRRDTVLNLLHLVDEKINPQDFFEQTHVTGGMRTLLLEALRRLAGKSSQAVFKLTQAMGGGKTHSLITLGLLAQHPQYRAKVLDGLPTAKELPPVRVVAFSGRESDIQNGIWGEIARQLGKESVFKEYYAPLKAPGQSAWVNLLKGEPTLILLDELPPYLDNARSITVGASDLSRVTVTALTNLFNAVAEDALPNVCIVLSDLVGTYAEASVQISGLLRQLQDEAQRHSMDLMPVQLNTDEFYEILKKRLFEEIPSAGEIKSVAKAYSQSVRDAKQMDITAQSPEKFQETIERSYPFHPAIRDLYARFKENQGFQQTRALIRLMRIVTARMWKTGLADKSYLIGVHHLDLNDQETLSEIRQINSKLECAIPHDIADQGKSAAELLDLNRGGNDAQDFAKLLFVSSLANVPNAVIGLSLPEIVAYLCEPGRDLTRLKNEVMEVLATKAWYMHSNRDGKLYFRDVQNLAAKVETLTQQFLREQAVEELRKRLGKLFAPQKKTCYQDVLPLPTPDELKTTIDSVCLVISEPFAGSGLKPELMGFWSQNGFKNRVAFLTGNRDNFEALVDTARRLKAVQHVLKELEDGGASETDPLFKEADSLQDRFLVQFMGALKETFSVLYFPSNTADKGDTLQSADFLMKFEGNKYVGEDQVIQILQDKQKYTEDVASETFRKKVELRLFTTDPMLWGQVKERAATNPKWQWHRRDALDALRQDLLHKEAWAEEGAGWIRKAPLAKKTAVQVKELGRDEDTGEVHLKVTPLNGDVVFGEVGGEPTEASKKIENGDVHTREMRMAFLAVDTTGIHPKGEIVEWQNRVTLKNRIFLGSNGKRMLELSAAPGGDGKTEIRFSTDGSDPANGGVYNGPFEIPAGAKVVLAKAQRDGISSELETIQIPVGEATKVMDPARPVVWARKHELKLTLETYAFLDRLKDCNGKASGIRIEVTGKQWADLTFEDSLQLQEPKLREAVELLRSMIQSGQVALSIGRVHFDQGQALLDWVSQEKLELSSAEWKQ